MDAAYRFGEGPHGQEPVNKLRADKIAAERQDQAAVERLRAEEEAVRVAVEKERLVAEEAATAALRQT